MNNETTRRIKRLKKNDVSPLSEAQKLDVKDVEELVIKLERLMK